MTIGRQIMEDDKKKVVFEAIKYRFEKGDTVAKLFLLYGSQLVNEYLNTNPAEFAKQVSLIPQARHSKRKPLAGETYYVDELPCELGDIKRIRTKDGGLKPIEVDEILDVVKIRHLSTKHFKI
jgi:hypothetical protein